MKYVIIGGDAAGMSAAMQIVRNDPGADITVFEKGSVYSYGQCGLPYVAGRLIDSTDDLIARSVETFRSKYGIDARILHEVTSISPSERTVSGKNHQSGEEFTQPYDRLLIATGASPVVPGWKGASQQTIHVMKTIPDTKRLLEDLDHEQVNDVVIIGAGYIGLEAAENIHRLGKRIRVIQRGSHIASMLDPDMAELLHQEAEQHGIILTLNETVESIEKGRVVTDRNQYRADLIMASVGVRPNTAFLKKTGIHMLPNGAITVNDRLETSVPGIYAAGDCASHFHLVKQKPDYIPLGTTANKQGRIAGLNMAGARRSFKGITGTSVFKFFNLIAASTGLTEKEAQQEGRFFRTSTIETKDRAGYYPGAVPLRVKILYDPKSRRLLGGQAIGQHGAEKRIDVLAAALFNQMTVEELEDLDLSYCPPVNGVWDPVQQAARRAT
ncbi:FAD-dependent oxidoreductase [Domibacillus indicus]|uniref:FAD-dependent oxidoreductase n=1 Tax=Domibacillus indicus TaxID=1437523 RepID=UPI0006181C92|nr:FAD-dependent oxidoreductase [Domibacillus indicus]